jgi:GNAT superfamily N-acetyltransferase
MIEFKPVDFRTVEHNFNLIHDHWKEVTNDNRELRPYWDAFHALEDAKMLRCYAAKTEHRIVGYTVFIIQRDMHAADTMVGYNDAVYLSREFRRNSLGVKFLQYCEDELRKEGMDVVMWHVKPSVDYSGTLERMGYDKFSTLYAKRV